MYLARKYYLYVSRLETRQPVYMVPYGQGAKVKPLACSAKGVPLGSTVVSGLLRVFN